MEIVTIINNLLAKVVSAMSSLCGLLACRCHLEWLFVPTFVNLFSSLPSLASVLLTIGLLSLV